MPFRFTKSTRKRDEAEWRIVTLRPKRRIPILGSVGLRAVRRLTPLPPEEPRVAKILSEVRRRQRLARAIAIVSLLVLLVAVWMGVGARAFSCLQEPCLPNSFRGHVAALEFARTVPDVQAIVGDLGNANREVMHRQLNRDFIFIGLYLVLYILLAVVLSRTRSVAPLLIVITVAAAVCTAGFDVLENVRALQVLNVPLAGLDGFQVAGILDAAVIKWTFSFVTAALLSLAFRYGDSLSKLLRALLLLTALIGLVGLVFHPSIPLSMLPLLIGLLVLIGSGLFRPLRLIKDS